MFNRLIITWICLPISTLLSQSFPLWSVFLRSADSIENTVCRIPASLGSTLCLIWRRLAIRRATFSSGVKRGRSGSQVLMPFNGRPIISSFFFSFLDTACWPISSFFFSSQSLESVLLLSVIRRLASPFFVAGAPASAPQSGSRGSFYYHSNTFLAELSSPETRVSAVSFPSVPSPSSESILPSSFKLSSSSSSST